MLFGCCCEQKTGGCRIEYPHRVAARLLFPHRTVPTLRLRGTPFIYCAYYVFLWLLLLVPNSRSPWCPSSSVSEIIAHYQAENEPGGAERALQRTADLRLSDTRVVAHRDFNHSESGQGAFEDHLHRPAIGGRFEGER